MQETWTFDYSLPLDPAKLHEFLNSKSRELGIFLSFYYKKQGAVAEQVEVKGQPTFTDQRSGEVTLAFDLVYFNACLAIDEQEREEMNINFELDQSSQSLQLTGAYWPERGMDEI